MRHNERGRPTLGATRTLIGEQQGQVEEKKRAMAITPLAPLRTALPVLAALLIGQGILTTGASAAPARRPALTSIKSVVLTTRDLTQVYGGRFRAFIDGVISNKYLASTAKTAGASSGPSMATAGRVTGYDSIWFRGSSKSSLSVINAVNEYKSTDFPQAAFVQIGRYKPAHTGLTFRLSPFSGAGDEAVALTLDSHGSTGRGIIFRRGRYLVELIVSTQHGKVNLLSLSKLAAIEDQRIQAHG